MEDESNDISASCLTLTSRTEQIVKWENELVSCGHKQKRIFEDRDTDAKMCEIKDQGPALSAICILSGLSYTWMEQVSVRRADKQCGESESSLITNIIRAEFTE